MPIILKHKAAINSRQRNCSICTMQVDDSIKSQRGKQHCVGSLCLHSNEFRCVLVNRPDLGGMFSERPSGVGKNRSNELSTNDNDSNSWTSVNIVIASEDTGQTQGNQVAMRAAQGLQT